MDWLVNRFKNAAHKDAFVHNDSIVTYGRLIEIISALDSRIASEGITSGQVVVVVGDFSPELFCLMIALAKKNSIIIPLSKSSVVEESAALHITGGDWRIEFSSDGFNFSIIPIKIVSQNTMLNNFKKNLQPGLVLFSSGSTGNPKAMLYSFNKILEKFHKQRPPIVAIPFLMVDHFGGINTILAITSSLGVVVTTVDRTVSSVCKAIEKYKVELLPTTPSFLAMLLASKLYESFDLSSLKRISYGTEVMPERILERLKKLFSDVDFLQTYGLSEVGVLRSKSKPDGSLWMKLGGDGFKTKVVENILWIKSDFAMEGYLNSPSEFDADGWFNTRDRVEVDGDYFKILGRATDIINVAGQKVYPAEVENFLLGLDNIRDVVIYSEPNALLGNIVVAKVQINNPESAEQLKRRIRKFCLDGLAPYKVPGKVYISEGPLYSVRQKKIRKAD
jgi:acyl-CoA synthetase (AMP-forming)/AMP-acid ligase II